MANGQVLAVDFGTSNSAAGVLVNGRPYLIEVEAGENTLPTAMFLEADCAPVYGRAAQRALTQGREGRYMRALKSVLGTPLMHESRRIMGAERTLLGIVAEFLATIKARAEAGCYTTFDSVLSGRPVRFHGDPDRDARAEADLRAAYHMAGFERVSFLYEPEAAALASPGTEGLGLIVDIGGGTSDFSVIQGGADLRVMASHGIRLGGTDFDRLLSLAHVMPLLGRGGLLRDAFGPGVNEAPQALFHDLATWQKIAFLYTPETLRFARDLHRTAVDKVPFGRLCEVLEAEMGHDLAFAVERGKIAAVAGGCAGIDLGQVEPGLRVALDRGLVDAVLAAEMGAIATAATDALALAGASAADVEQVIYVGGSSLMPGVAGAIAGLCPAARVARGAAFTGVVDGLCIAAARR